MRISRIFYVGALSSGQMLTLDAATSQYLSRVLRLRSGDALVIFNGEGGQYSAILQATNRRDAQVLLGEHEPGIAESALPIHLGQGVSRGERMDYVIQKAVELGVTSITPLLTERCGVKLDAVRIAKRLSHWQGVAVSACEQSGRCVVPTVNAPRPIANWLTDAPGLCLVCDTDSSNALAATEVPEQVSLLIGPEGGLSDDELSQAKAAGWQSMSLGPRVLRTETAPVAALALIQARWGDLS